MNYKNLGQDFCNNRKLFCESLKAFVEENTVFMKPQIEKYSEIDNCWHQLILIHKQLEGMQKGYELWKEENNRIPDEIQFLSEILFLDLWPEMEDFEQFLSPETARYERHCSALIKPLADRSDLFIGHNMWASHKIK
jgi:hypothetical protein